MFIHTTLIFSKEASMGLEKSAGDCVYINTLNIQGP